MSPVSSPVGTGLIIGLVVGLPLAYLAHGASLRRAQQSWVLCPAVADVDLPQNTPLPMSRRAVPCSGDLTPAHMRPDEASKTIEQLVQADLGKQGPVPWWRLDPSREHGRTDDDQHCVEEALSIAADAGALSPEVIEVIDALDEWANADVNRNDDEFEVPTENEGLAE